MRYNKETILYGTKMFGYLLDREMRLNNYEFAELIKDSYSLMNPITNKVFNEIRKASDLYFERHLDECKIIRI